MFIHQLAIKRLPLMALVVLGALVDLVASVVSLFVSVATAKANTAPEGSYHLISIDGADAVNNWDYDSTENVGDDTVDWGMRFLFAGDVVNVNYVKNRLDGDGDDSTITPELDGVGFAKFAWIDDGQEQTDSNWDMDWGIKNYPGCTWNSGHMRVYAQTGEDHNYGPTLGNSVIASIHVDQERFGITWMLCHTQYKSFEIDEWIWRYRIGDNLTVSPYNWSIGEEFNWRNPSAPSHETVQIGDGNSEYQSDGLGSVIHVAHAE